MTRKLLLIFGILMLVAFVEPGFAQVGRHPRVSELEKTLAKEGLELLKGRFPDRPFLLKVKIDPLFRDRSRVADAGDKLPYMDIADGEAVDEWDDPDTTDALLLNRVTRIHVEASIPSDLTDDEMSELKDSLMSHLGLIPGRDSVEINKRSWGARTEKDDQLFDRNTITLTIVGWILFSAALLGASWYAGRRIGRELKASAPASDKGQSAAPVPMAPPPMIALPQDSQRAEARASGNDVRVSDPIRTREILRVGLRALKDQTAFPNLEDMMILHKFGESNPKALGALLFEFPIEQRNSIFGLSYSDFWLDAVSNPGEVTNECIEVVNKCLRVQRKDGENDRAYEELKILIWRLQERTGEFFRGLDQTEVFSLLFDLPKKLSLDIGRTFFPGTWGLLLDSGFKPEVLSPERVQKLREKALSLVALRHNSAIEKYKRDRDLLDFVRVSNLATEKDVYVAVGASSFLPSIRPPFYKVLELSDESLSQLVPKMKIEDWAYALFNVSNTERKKVEAKFNDKQRYRFIEVLRSLDANPPSQDVIGGVRERAARLAAEIEKSRLGASIDALNALGGDEEDEQSQAA